MSEWSENLWSRRRRRKLNRALGWILLALFIIAAVVAVLLLGYTHTRSRKDTRGLGTARLARSAFGEQRVERLTNRPHVGSRRRIVHGQAQRPQRAVNRCVTRGLGFESRYRTGHYGAGMVRRLGIFFGRHDLDAVFTALGLIFTALPSYSPR